MLVIVAAAFALTRHEESVFPESLLGVARLQGPDADEFDRVLRSMALGDMELRGAIYGTISEPVLIVELFVGNLEQVHGFPLEATFRAAAGGFAGSSGGLATVDVDAEVHDTRSATDYVCAPLRWSTAFAPPGGSTRCMWDGESTGFVISFRTAYTAAAIDDTQAVAEAIDG